MLGVTQLVGFGAGGSVLTPPANQVNFDGTNDYLTRGADLGGNVNGKQGIISFWIRLDGGDGVAISIIQATSGRIQCARQADNTIQFLAQNTAPATILAISTVNAYVSGSGFHHVLASWDMAVAGSGSIYVDDVKDYAETTFTDDTIDYTQANHSVGASVAGVDKINACLADVYVNYAEYLDFDIVANRRKFIDATLKAVDLGSDGSTPTGTAPIAFFSGATATWHTNDGSGGGYTENGALTTCS